MGKYAGIIIIRKSDGKVLYQHRDGKSSIPTPNKWSNFGGAVEDNESPKEAIIREVKEELDYRIQKPRLKHLITLPLLIKTFIIYYYVINDNEIKKLKLKEGQGMKFMNRKEFLRLNNAYWLTRIGMKYYLTNKKINKLVMS